MTGVEASFETSTPNAGERAGLPDLKYAPICVQSFFRKKRMISKDREKQITCAQVLSPKKSRSPSASLSPHRRRVRRRATWNSRRRAVCSRGQNTSNGTERIARRSSVSRPDLNGPGYIFGGPRLNFGIFWCLFWNCFCFSCFVAGP